MRVRDLIEELVQIEKDYGNLPIFEFVEILIFDDRIILNGERRG